MKPILPEGVNCACRADKPKFYSRLPGYSLIFVKVIGSNRGWYYDFFLILLANRFNSAYYLLLDAGRVVRWWDQSVDVCRGVVGNAPNCRTPKVPGAEGHCHREQRSLFLFGSNSSLLVRRNRKKFIRFFEGGFGSIRSNPRIWRIILRDW